MKIVHVISSIDPAKGGPQATCVRLAAAQSALGHDVHIVSYGGREIQKRAFQSARDVPHFSRIVWHLLPDPNRIERVLGLAAARKSRTVLEGASFMHIHGVWEPILKNAAAVARRNQIPYCIQPHGMLDVWSMQQKRLKKHAALALGYRKMLNRAKFLLALNSDEAQLLEPLHLSAPNLIIPNGIFLEEFAELPAKGFFAERLPRLDGKRVVLFLSRLHTKKGLDILAQAFVLLAGSYPDVDLVVAGPDGGARDAFVTLVDQLGIEDRVHLTGPLYGNGKLRALVDASCFCLPSRQEGFSVAITEAMACGLPVVVSDACHFPEVKSAHAGAVVSLDPAEVASALAGILDNPAMASIMGRNGQRLVRENYTWPRIAEQTIQGYQSGDNRDAKMAENSAVLMPAADH
ncbi:glycosyltransferase [Phyllobacterium sp. A18/5-2]|jgi:glycosyltransferase involved in cell wall biosynthesis|uniref:glycosyltransferase n=1 Tax=Phyllobacterium sp. A18/5-2 TaxID=2978392 RepID=UPI0021C8C8E9|nr:glycosyltransferase [Phyllobacterium sp. A18/5-2]UXN65703.1 glycosyltransferase [Phyllobacterium sp. A18/5-2]